MTLISGGRWRRLAAWAAGRRSLIAQSRYRLVALSRGRLAAGRLVALPPVALSPLALSPVALPQVALSVAYRQCLAMGCHAAGCEACRFKKARNHQPDGAIQRVMRVYDKAIEMNEMLARVAPAVGRHDRDLLAQLKRAASSVALNIAEGLGHRGGNRELRFESALGSALEVRACLHVAAAWGCAGCTAPNLIDTVDHVVHMLSRLVRARQ
jgi:four helix bundle protein